MNKTTYKPPQRLLIPCPQCGVTVLRGMFKEGRIVKLAVPKTPVKGDDHVCPPTKTRP